MTHPLLLIDDTERLSVCTAMSGSELETVWIFNQNAKAQRTLPSMCFESRLIARTPSSSI